MQASLKSGKNNGYFTWRPIYIFFISRSILLRIKNDSDKICRENRNTHFAFNNFFFFFESRGVYEKTWRNTVEPDRPQITVWLLQIVCWIPKAINTHSHYIIIIAFPLQKWLHERASILRYTFIASPVYLRDQPNMQDAWICVCCEHCWTEGMIRVAKNVFYSWHWRRCILQ